MIAAYILLGLTAAFVLLLLVLNVIPLFQIGNLWQKIKAWDFDAYDIDVIKRAAYMIAVVAFIAVVVIIAVNA